MEWKERIVKKTIKNKTSWQPQIKRDCWYSFLLNWQPLTMLIINDNYDVEGIELWSTKVNAEKELERFILFQDEL